MQIDLDTSNYDKNNLTAREMQIIKMIICGAETRDIAKSLYISEYTVSNHRKNAKRKIGYHNTAHLIQLYNHNEVRVS